LCGAQVIAEHTALTGIQQIAPKWNFLHYASDNCQNTKTVLY
jgi:hypothetical protein